MSDTVPPRRILVAGDLVVDHHLYQGERPKPVTDGRRGVRHVAEVGGAGGIVKLLKAMAEADTRLFAKAEEAWAKAGGGNGKIMPQRKPVPCEPKLGIVAPTTEAANGAHHAFALWQPVAQTRRSGEQWLVWRAGLKMGYGHAPIADAAEALHRPVPCPTTVAPDLLVLDDAGYTFRKIEHRTCWHLPATDSPPWLLLKLGEPIARGDLWRALVPDDPAAAGLADRLVCVVAARDLREEAVRISTGFSWESTLEDLADELARPALAPLARCRHLIVAFGGDGALWIDREATGRALLCFDAGGIEGTFAARFDGEAVGYLTTMAGALAYGLAQTAAGAEPALQPWVEGGLRGMRDLLERGHGECDPREPPAGFPADRLAAVMLAPGGAQSLATAIIAWPPLRAAQRARSIVAASQRPLGSRDPGSLAGLAAEVTRRGTVVLAALPHATFGRFVTAERAEIEALRVVESRMADYRARARPGERPLSIGVFGPPGAGKSFAVREIAGSVFGHEAWLEFNLSQFRNEDLNGAFHQVRDRVLEGKIPVVFWDEFDAHGYEWLQYLLAPMQDGRFQQGPVSHAVSRCVFIFAGGTCADFAGFGPPGGIVDEARWKLLKGPDFRSRLDAVYNVPGPNRRRLDDGSDDAADIGYTLRRALLLRGQLRLGANEPLTIDAALLRALLLVPRYGNGARSLEKLLRAMGRGPGGALRRSDLPHQGLLAMHTDAAAFLTLLDRDRGFNEGDMIEDLAEAIHENYREQARREDWPIAPEFDRPYAQLDDAQKEDNRAAARRIPAVLALAGLGLEKLDGAEAAPGPDGDELRAHLEHNMERLAEAEHDGWMEVRRRAGWVAGEPRDDARRIHPLMVPYANLSQLARDRDRASVRAYPDQVLRAGYRIVWL